MEELCGTVSTRIVAVAQDLILNETTNCQTLFSRASLLLAGQILHFIPVDEDAVRRTIRSLHDNPVILHHIIHPSGAHGYVVAMQFRGGHSSVALQRVLPQGYNLLLWIRFKPASNTTDMAFYPITAIIRHHTLSNNELQCAHAMADVIRIITERLFHMPFPLTRFFRILFQKTGRGSTEPVGQHNLDAPSLQCFTYCQNCFTLDPLEMICECYVYRRRRARRGDARVDIPPGPPISVYNAEYPSDEDGLFTPMDRLPFAPPASAAVNVPTIPAHDLPTPASQGRNLLAPASQELNAMVIPVHNLPAPASQGRNLTAPASQGHDLPAPASRGRYHDVGRYPLVGDHGLTVPQMQRVHGAIRRFELGETGPFLYYTSSTWLEVDVEPFDDGRLVVSYIVSYRTGRNNEHEGHVGQFYH